MTKPFAYYNEFDADKAEGLRELMKEGVIAPGEVDERSITDIEPADLVGFRQVHLFAGIGIWSYACRQAGISDADSVWTFSCPCPPFSVAGKSKDCPSCGQKHLVAHAGRTGYFVCVLCQTEWFADARHLFPEVWQILRNFRPDLIYGEQVASRDGHTWFATVRASMEILGYAVRGFDLCSASVGATDIRQRLYFMAYHKDIGVQRVSRETVRARTQAWLSGRTDVGHGDPDNTVADSTGDRRHRKGKKGKAQARLQPGSGEGGKLPDGSQGLGAVHSGTGADDALAHSPKRRRKQRDEGERPVRKSNKGRKAGATEPDAVVNEHGTPAADTVPARRKVNRGRGSVDSTESVANDDKRRLEELSERDCGSESGQQAPHRTDVGGCDSADRTGTVGVAEGERLQGLAGYEQKEIEERWLDARADRRTVNAVDESGSSGTMANTNRKRGRKRIAAPEGLERKPDFVEPGYTNGFWRDAVWIRCLDTDPDTGANKYRAVGRVEPESLSLDAGIARDLGHCTYEGTEVIWPTVQKSPNRNMRIRCYGDAINGELATSFVLFSFDE